jgi:hypothetical protein
LFSHRTTETGRNRAPRHPLVGRAPGGEAILTGPNRPEKLPADRRTKPDAGTARTLAARAVCAHWSNGQFKC